MTHIITKGEGAVVVNTVAGKAGFDSIANFALKNIDTWIGKSVLWDVGKMDFNNISCDDLYAFVQKKIINSAVANKSGGKTAFVAPHDLQFGMMRALASLTEISSSEVSVGVFRTMNEAKSWLLEA